MTGAAGLGLSCCVSQVRRASRPTRTGSASASVSENVHWWPAKSSALVLPLAVLEVGRLHQDPRAILPGPRAVTRGRRPRAPSPRWVDLARARGAAVAAHVGDDHRAVADLELRPVGCPRSAAARQTRTPRPARRPPRAHPDRSAPGSPWTAGMERLGFMTRTSSGGGPGSGYIHPGRWISTRRG